MPENVRVKICNEYWDRSDYTLQRDYIAARIVSGSKMRRTKKDAPSRREHTHQYFFIVDKKRVSVCKKFFTATLSISDKIIRTALSKRDRQSGGITSPDKRGRHTPWNAMPEATKQFALNHIDSFPRVPSHYCRKDNKKVYLEAILNKTKMYQYYKEECAAARMPRISITSYCNLLEEKRIAFHKPKKDLCWCFDFENKPEEERNRLQGRHEAHKQRQKEATEYKQGDRERAKTDPTFISANFDLQAVLYCPLMNAKPIFYRRKLAVYNLSIYEVNSRNGHCFIWPETQGKRGANEIASCLWMFLKSLPATVKHVGFCSDSCAGQNKNSIVAAMFQYAVRVLPLITIDHGFLEPGHTQMEANSSLHWRPSHR